MVDPFAETIVPVGTAGMVAAAVAKFTEASPGTEVMLQFLMSEIPENGESATPASKPSITRLSSKSSKEMAMGVDVN